MKLLFYAVKLNENLSSCIGKVELLFEKLTLEAFAVVKLTVVALLLFPADIPSTVIFPVELLPIFSIPAVIFASSPASMVELPVVPPKPIVPPLAVEIVVSPVPLESEPDRLTSFAVSVSALFPVDNVLDVLI